MKKLVLFCLLFLPILLVVAQDVSPYSGNNGSDPNNPYTNQITYFDINYVDVKIQSFLQQRLGLTPYKEHSVTKKSDTDFNITYSFQNNGFNTPLKILNFNYDVFTIDHYFVIKELRITGDIDLLVEFWAKYWTTTPNFNRLQSNLLVTNYFLQDKISFFGGKNAKIIIVNTSITDIDAFKNDFAKRQEEKKIIAAKISVQDLKLKIRQAQIDSINAVYSEQEKRYASRETKNFDIKVKKTDTGVSFYEEYPDGLKKAVEQCLSKQHNGRFIVRVFENYELGKIYEYQANLLEKLNPIQRLRIR